MEIVRKPVVLEVAYGKVVSMGDGWVAVQTTSLCVVFFFSSRRRHTRLQGDWSSDVCSSDLPQSAHHLSVRDTADALRGLVHIQPELVAEPLHRALGRLAVQLDLAGQRGVGGQQAEHQVRVGDGRLLAPEAVAGRPGPGARGLGADAQRAAGVTPGDRAAAGADRVDV